MTKWHPVGAAALASIWTYATMIARLVTFDERGRERLLGEYMFHHTRSLPGPGAG